VQSAWCRSSVDVEILQTAESQTNGRSAPVRGSVPIGGQRRAPSGSGSHEAAKGRLVIEQPAWLTRVAALSAPRAPVTQRSPSTCTG
jgi:hypothetical protein